MNSAARNPLSSRDWTALWESAAAAAIAGTGGGRVYAGPAWEMSSPSPSLPARVWKLAVLERKTGGGAEHWGHLLVVLDATPRDVTIQPDRSMPGGRTAPPTETLPAPAGVPWEVRIRPLAIENAPRLRAFAIEFQRYAEQLAREEADHIPGR